MVPRKIKYKRDVKLWPAAGSGALFLNNVEKTTISPVGVSASMQKYLDALRNYDNQHAYANRVATSFPTDYVFACTHPLHAERIFVRSCVSKYI